MHMVRIPLGTRDILANVLCVFPQFSQLNVGVVPDYDTSVFLILPNRPFASHLQYCDK